MSWWSALRAAGAALGIGAGGAEPAGCELGRSIYRETKRATMVVNVRRRPRPLAPTTVARLAPWFPELDLRDVRVRTSCRLPPNRFAASGDIYAMTFGSTICWRDELDEGDERDLVRLAHELVHVDQVRRLGGESAFACAYGRGYVDGDGELPAHVRHPSRYHRNPLEAEAYRFEAQFRDATGRIVPGRLDVPPAEPPGTG